MAEGTYITRSKYLILSIIYQNFYLKPLRVRRIRGYCFSSEGLVSIVPAATSAKAVFSFWKEFFFSDLCEKKYKLSGGSVVE